MIELLLLNDVETLDIRWFLQFCYISFNMVHMSVEILSC